MFHVEQFKSLNKMERIEIDGKKYAIRIYPVQTHVCAEIYYIKSGSFFEITVITKEFGSFWRKPIEKDYVKAKAWAVDQLNFIRKANDINYELEKEQEIRDILKYNITQVNKTIKEYVE